MFLCEILQPFNGRDGRVKTVEDSPYSCEKEECDRLVAALCLKVIEEIEETGEADEVKTAEANDQATGAQGRKSKRNK